MMHGRMAIVAEGHAVQGDGPGHVSGRPREAHCQAHRIAAHRRPASRPAARKRKRALAWKRERRGGGMDLMVRVRGGRLPERERRIMVAGDTL